MSRNRRWPLVVIAIPAAVEVWTCWVGLGSLCGFPKLGDLSTDWTLATGMEAYGAYALYVWLGAAPGPRSRGFAQWSSLGAFALSLIGQVAYHLMLARHIARAPAVVIVFVACLLVVVLAFAAILTHLMHADARDAEKAARENAAAEAEAAELTALRDALNAERAARNDAEAERDNARQEAAEAVRAEVEAAAKAEALARKLDALKARKPGAATGRKPAGVTGRKQDAATAPVSGSATAPETDSDVDREALVLKYLAEGHSASEAGKLAGLSDSRGRQIARKLAAAAPKGPDATPGGGGH